VVLVTVSGEKCKNLSRGENWQGLDSTESPVSREGLVGSGRRMQGFPVTGSLTADVLTTITKPSTRGLARKNPKGLAEALREQVTSQMCL
jgi:hypothetical protein